MWIAPFVENNILGQVKYSITIQHPGLCGQGQLLIKFWCYRNVKREFAHLWESAFSTVVMVYYRLGFEASRFDLIWEAMREFVQGFKITLSWNSRGWLTKNGSCVILYPATLQIPNTLVSDDHSSIAWVLIHWTNALGLSHPWKQKAKTRRTIPKKTFKI